MALSLSAVIYLIFYFALSQSQNTHLHVYLIVRVLVSLAHCVPTAIFPSLFDTLLLHFEYYRFPCPTHGFVLCAAIQHFCPFDPVEEAILCCFALNLVLFCGLLTSLYWKILLFCLYTSNPFTGAPLINSTQPHVYLLPLLWFWIYLCLALYMVLQTLQSNYFQLPTTVNYIKFILCKQYGVAMGFFIQVRRMFLNNRWKKFLLWMTMPVITK